MTITLAPMHIPQAIADIRALRKKGGQENAEAANALQDAVDQARLQMAAPELLALGSLFPMDEHTLFARAIASVGA